jgi:DNA transposition AAA+ family ATPase
MTEADGRSRFVDGLSTDARILKVARMLPNEGPLTEEQHAEVRGLYKKWTYRRSLTDAQAAKQMGYSASVISQWKDGKYKGDNDTVTRVINNWMEQDARAQGARLDLEYVSTIVAEDMRALVRIAHARGQMLALVAPSGSGKTRVLEVLVAETRGFYIYCDGDMTPTGFLKSLARAVGVPAEGTKHDIKELIIGKLKGTRRPIFLDEAHLLPPGVFARIRSIHDQTGVPFVMAGTGEILRRIDDQAGGNGQMASRCLRYSAMEQCIDADDPSGTRNRQRHLFSREEIEQFFAQLNVKLTPDAFEMLWAVACQPGNGCLRTVRNVVELIMSRHAGQRIDAGLVRDVLVLALGHEGASVYGKAKAYLEAIKKVA